MKPICDVMVLDVATTSVMTAAKGNSYSYVLDLTTPELKATDVMAADLVTAVKIVPDVITACVMVADVATVAGATADVGALE
jgi:hypothetical protein